MRRMVIITGFIGRSSENSNAKGPSNGLPDLRLRRWRSPLRQGQMSRVDSIKGAIALRERIGEAVAAVTPIPNPRVPESAPPIFHWLGVKPPVATGLTDAVVRAV
jgi:hypothetical protein